MELEIRPLNENDYQEILVDWWKQWDWVAPVKDFLPEDGKGGMIVYDGITPICAGFIYITNSKVAWVDWIISNKEYKIKDKRRAAIKMLIESLTNISRNTGSKYAYALIKNQSLIKTYEDLGYTKGGSYTSEMIKLL
jgi:RimJ/RimL family protein N-acetyltransferase